MSNAFRVQLFLHYDGIVVASFRFFYFFIFLIYTRKNKAIKIPGTVKEEHILAHPFTQQGREHFSVNKP